MPKTQLLGRAPRFKFGVKQKHINAAKLRDSSHCMTAEAMKEANPDLVYVAVDIQTIRATSRKKRERYVWLTPRTVQFAIVNWDQGKEIKPFPCDLREGQTIASGRRAVESKGRRGGKFRRQDPKSRSVPGIVGGVAPPRSVGARRQFGLRSLKY